MGNVYDKGKEALFKDGIAQVIDNFIVYETDGSQPVGDSEPVEGNQSFTEDTRQNLAGFKYNENFQLFFDGTFEGTDLSGITFREGNERLVDIDFDNTNIIVPEIGSYISYNPDINNLSLLIDTSGNITERGALAMTAPNRNGLANEIDKIVAVAQTAVGETTLNPNNWFYDDGELRYVEDFEIEVSTGSSEDIEELRLEDSSGNILWRFPVSTFNIPSAGGFITHRVEDPTHDLRMGLEEE